MAKKEDKCIMEADLFLPIQLHLESLGYSVNGEVLSCDLLANKDDEWIVVELKKSLNLEVILQAAERQKISDIVYIAVIKPRNFLKSSKYKRICHLLRRLEIGLMLVNFNGKEPSVEVVHTAEIFDRVKSQRANQNKRKKTQEEFKKRKSQSVGGVTRTKVMTAYREQAIEIAKLLEEKGLGGPKDLKELGIDTKQIQNVLYKNYYGWFNRLSQGIYETSEAWRAFKKES